MSIFKFDTVKTREYYEQLETDYNKAQEIIGRLDQANELKSRVILEIDKIVKSACLTRCGTCSPCCNIHCGYGQINQVLKDFIGDINE